MAGEEKTCRQCGGKLGATSKWCSVACMDAWEVRVALHPYRGRLVLPLGWTWDLAYTACAVGPDNAQCTVVADPGTDSATLELRGRVPVAVQEVVERTWAFNVQLEKELEDRTLMRDG